MITRCCIAYIHFMVAHGFAMGKSHFQASGFRALVETMFYQFFGRNTFGRPIFNHFLARVRLENQFFIHCLPIFIFFCICSHFFAFFEHFELVLDLVWGLSGNFKSTPCLVRAPSRRAQSMEIMMETHFFAFFLFQKS